MKPNETSADYRAHLEAIASKKYEPRSIRELNTDPKPGFYVSVIDPEAGRKALAEGPFPTHMEALVALDAVKAAWDRVDHRTFWYAWGTARVKEEA